MLNPIQPPAVDVFFLQLKDHCDQVDAHYKGLLPQVKGHPCWIGWTCQGEITTVLCILYSLFQCMYTTPILNLLVSEIPHLQCQAQPSAV